jgi:hypothetical protein
MPYPASVSDLALFQQKLLGTWSNNGVPLGTDNKPLSYNVMPLPQVEKQASYPCCLGYILKNFTFTETIRFNNYDNKCSITTPATAPNRGGRYSQIAQAVFYDQKVFFAEGPDGPTNPDGAQAVHIENGAWLWLTSSSQNLGPYNNVPAPPGPITPQPPFMNVAKQIAVPHGNSVLALGSVGEIMHVTPQIPDMPYPYPGSGRGEEADIPVFPYYTKLNQGGDYENPNLDYTFNPNLPLQEAVGQLRPDAHLHWSVTTDPLPDAEHPMVQGSVTNIPFEHRRANVASYKAEYWLLSTDGGQTFDYLAYNQFIGLVIPLAGQPYTFPHVTANVVKRQGP